MNTFRFNILSFRPVINTLIAPYQEHVSSYQVADKPKPIHEALHIIVAGCLWHRDLPYPGPQCQRRLGSLHWQGEVHASRPDRRRRPQTLNWHGSTPVTPTVHLVSLKLNCKQSMTNVHVLYMFYGSTHIKSIAPHNFHLEFCSYQYTNFNFHYKLLKIK